VGRVPPALGLAAGAFPNHPVVRVVSRDRADDESKGRLARTYLVGPFEDGETNLHPGLALSKMHSPPDIRSTNRDRTPVAPWLEKVRGLDRLLAAGRQRPGVITCPLRSKPPVNSRDILAPRGETGWVSFLPLLQKRRQFEPGPWNRRAPPRLAPKGQFNARQVPLLRTSQLASAGRTRIPPASIPIYGTRNVGAAGRGQSTSAGNGARIWNDGLSERSGPARRVAAIVASMSPRPAWPPPLPSQPRYCIDRRFCKRTADGRAEKGRRCRRMKVRISQRRP